MSACPRSLSARWSFGAASTAACRCAIAASTFPAKYAFWPATRSGIACAAGSGPTGGATLDATPAAPVVPAGNVINGRESVLAARGCGAELEGMSTMLMPPSATHAPTMPTVVHGIGRGAAGACRATSGCWHRGHLLRAALTFAPHAAQMTAGAAAVRLKPDTT